MNCSNTDYRYISLACEQAIKSPVLYKHGCVAVVSGKIIASGYNNYRTYSKDGMIKNSCTCHAEVDVLRKCLKQNIYKKIKLYVIRISFDNRILLSKPCNECYKTMKLFEIKQIIYSDAMGNIIKQTMTEFIPSHQSSGYNAIKNNKVLML
jgi:tRNA(Arg) A34 adenosine deaminase TadA